MKASTSMVSGRIRGVRASASSPALIETFIRWSSSAVIPISGATRGPKTSFR